MENQSIVEERLFNVPIETIWKALTNRDEMEKWYFNLAAFKAEVGFKFQFKGGHEDGIQYVHLCEIKEVIPNEKISYSWCYEGYSGYSLVSFELTEQSEKTLLKLTHTGVESFKNINNDFAKESFMAGWNHIINISLKDFLEPV